MNQQPLQTQSSFMGWLQASTGTLGAIVSHTGNTLPSSMVGATQGGASGKGSPRALLHPTLRGCGESYSEEIASPTMVLLPKGTTGDLTKRLQSVQGRG